MPVNSLAIEQFRNLQPVNLEFSPQLNLFIGANAAGKTSLLESLYVLARVKSFRTPNLDKAIQTGTNGFQLVATVLKGQERLIPVGISRSEKKKIVRIDGEPVKRLSDLAALFPVHWLGGNLHRLVDEGPVYRRQYLDWGVFHVKPTYMPVWKKFQKLLKQRNAALRSAVATKEIDAWDTELAIAGEELHRLRKSYLSCIGPVIEQIVGELLDLNEHVVVRYRKGWFSESTYRETLKKGLEKDRELGYTRAGPQRAELEFLYLGKPARETLSRGQQKLLVLALKLAQAQFLRQEIQQNSLFLIDDLGAELDKENQGRVMHLLKSIQAQVFVTAIDNPVESNGYQDQTRRFHVKHGMVSEMV